MSLLQPTAILLAFTAALIATFVLSRTGGRLQILDRPNERSLHTMPIPRTGGLAIWLGCGLGMSTSAFLEGMSAVLPWIGAAALLVGWVSFIDDRSPLPARTRLLAQLFAASLLLAGGLSPNAIDWPGGELALQSGWAWLVGLLFVVWVCNLYNFMDGIDGFAGGMAVFGFGTLGVLAYLGGDVVFATLCWVIAAAAAGFLVWNFPPARIFMGDTGSSTLGLLVAAMSLWGDRQGLFPLWIAALVFSPFIVDATLTLIRRTAQGKRIWEAHRSHYYQRLVRSGWSHRRTTLWSYVLMSLCSAAALLAADAEPASQWCVIGGALLLYVAVVVAVHAREHRMAVAERS